MTKQSPQLTKAFEFMVAGYSVMPVGKNKRPLLPSWKKLQTERADEDLLMEWWKKHPTANVGIITGKISGISVVDIDVKGGKKIDLKKFPETFTVQTPSGGYHLYYQYQEGLSISANAYPQFPFVDIRSDGGFVVAPSSITEYRDDKTGEKKGGEYKVIKNIAPAPFPTKLFPPNKKRKTLTQKIGVATGGRNDSIASFAGQLLQAEQNTEKWETEVWGAVVRANKTYSPPLPDKELRTTFESIMKKELERRDKLILSPIQPDGSEVQIRLRRSRTGSAYKDMANALLVLQKHPYYKDTLRYNEFRQEIEYNDRPFEEGDLVKIQHFMQTEGDMPSIAKEAVYAAVAHYANENSYDEAKDWLKSLAWDGTPRLFSWLHSALKVEDDAYHQGIGTQWIMGMINRIMNPGSTFDYVLVVVGRQGIGKTSLFRIIGGKWYKSYTGAIDNKDFYLALRGAMIVDLDEGAALYRSEAIKIKSIITETHDEYRAPYDRVMKKYPRRFVFSMSTNDTEPFRDVTGNRRYWTIDATERVDFEWLQENRDQLFAEAYHHFKEGTKLPEVPFDIATERQQMHLPDDSWTDLVKDAIQKDRAYRTGDENFATTIIEVFSQIFPSENLSRLGKQQEMRVANIFKHELGLEKRREMIDGERRVKWMLTREKAEQLRERPAKDTRDEFDKYGEDEFTDEDLPFKDKKK